MFTLLTRTTEHLLWSSSSLNHPGLGENSCLKRTLTEFQTLCRYLIEVK